MISGTSYSESNNKSFNQIDNNQSATMKLSLQK